MEPQKEEEGQSTLRAASIAVLATWAAELALARVTGEPQTALDMGESLLGLGLLGVAPAALLARCVALGWPRSALLGLTAATPMAVVAFGILLPVLLNNPALGAAGSAALLGAITAWRTVRAQHRNAPFPGPMQAVAVVATASLAVWLLKDGTLPPFSMLGPLFLVFAIIGLAGSKTTLFPVVIAAVALFAWFPRLSLQPDWTNEAEPATGPDIIMLVVDTLRADVGETMSSYQRIAAEGVAFRETQAASPWTTPSMGAMFTGLRAPEHGALRLAGMGAGSILPSVPTLAERLRDAGYDTAAIVTSDSAGPERGFGRGFDVLVHDAMQWSMPRARSSRNARPTVARLLTIARVQGRPPSSDAGELSRIAVEIIENRRSDRPMLLWVHYMDCHLPYKHAEQIDVPRNRSIELDNGHTGILKSDPYWRTAQGIETFRVGYQWEVDGIDDAIQQVLDALGPAPERGRVVLLSSDHGEEFFDHGSLLHGHAFYQELISVPLAISGLPGREPGSEEHSVVGHVDIMPTLLAAAGVPSDGGRGQNLAKPIAQRIYVTENLSTQPFDERIAAREGDWKLIVGPGDETRLYHLGDDPDERTNLASRHPEVIARLSAALHVEAAEPIPVELSDEDHRMLEALGYVEE